MAAVAEREQVAVAGLGRLVWGRGISALGDGLWFTIWALYFTRILGLSPGLVGVGMALGGAAGLAAAVPLGALADRFDARTVLVALTAVRAAAMAGYAFAGQPWVFLVATVLFTGSANGASAVRTALVAALVPGTRDRTAALARQRVAQHIGYALGAGAGSLVLAADQAAGYRLAVVANVVTFAVLVVITATVGAVPPRPGAGRAGIRPVLRDRPYLAVVGLVSVMSLCWAMLSTGLPLWLSTGTRLPLSLNGAVVAISSVGIALLQVRVTRLAGTVARAARTAVWSGVALAVACALLATTGGAAGAAGVAVVTLAALFHLAGELGYVGASWGLSVELMREDARGAYQGATEAATATVQTFAPGFFTLALTSAGAGGWLLAGAVFLACAAPVPALARWAARTR
ncbi:MFS transporter [Sphaerisporangium rufum]|uniref:MFS transporter n=1 Tax=Sphaerisporangium rufum TaxID=1381558 RepID=UPI0019501FFB|nr:MFS transporter [Sphaerisporangium rufum]